MATLALDPAYRRVTVDEFLAMDFGGARAELEDGIIFMMAGVTAQHARVAANLVAFLLPRLRGTGCRPFGSDLAVRTGEATVRFPDVSIYCNDPADRDNDRKQLLGDPHVIVEVLSPSTSSHDQKTKLFEYQALPGLREIVFVDPDEERVRLLVRTERGGWSGDWLEPGDDVRLRALDLAISHAEIFARD